MKGDHCNFLVDNENRKVYIPSPRIDNMKKQTIKKTTSIVYYAVCKHCGKEIKGSKMEEVEWNMDVHLKSCAKKKEAEK